MANDPILRCPVCLNRASVDDLGMRDYRWVSPFLPGRVAPMDMDFLLEKNGEFLVLEFKPKTGALGMGTRISYKALVRSGLFDVWVVWEESEHSVVMAVMDKRGELLAPTVYTKDELAQKVADWYAEKSEKKSG